MKTQTQFTPQLEGKTAFEALCDQHRALLEENGPWGWGTIAIEVAQEHQRKLIESQSSLHAALKDLIDVCEGIDMWATHQAAKDARKALELAATTQP